MVVATYDAIWRADTKQAKAALRSLRAEMAMMTNNMNATVGFVKNTIGTVAKAAIGAFAAVTIATAASIAAVKEFDKNLTHAGAIANLTKGEVEKLGMSINQLSVQFGQSANDMSAGVVELTKAGLDMGEIAMVTDDITKAMLANSISFETAAQVGVFAVKQFGESFADLSYQFDVIQKVTQETIMDFGDMQQALAYAGSTAILARVPFEELMAIMGTLSQRAMEMGIASRSVNQMMMSLIDNGDEMQAWINEMGLGVDVIKDGALNLNELIKAFSTLDMTMEQLQRSSDIFSVRALRSWGLLITGADEYLKLLEEDIPNAAGTLDQVYQAQAKSISFQMAQLREIFLSPMRTPEFMGSLADMISELKQPVADLSKILFEGLWNFLLWTKDNAKEVVGFFQHFLDFVLHLVAPLYNIGQIFLTIGDGALEALFYLKAMHSLNVHTYFTAFAKSLAVTNKNLEVTATRGQMAATTMGNLAMAMGGIVMSSYLMGRAFGKEMENMIMMTLAMTSIMAGLQTMIYAPSGTKIIAGLGVAGLTFGAGYGAYQYGKSQYQSMEAPDMSGFENIIKNIDYTASSPSTSGGGTSSPMGFGGAPGGNTYITVEGDIYGDTKFDRKVRRVIDG